MASLKSTSVTGTLSVSTDATVTGDLTVNGGDIIIGGTGRIQGIDTVSASTDAANKAYVDAASGGSMGNLKAWVNFNGAGTVAIRASGNVSSITDNGLGRYTVNFAAAMPDINYSVSTQGGIVTTVGPGIGVIQVHYSAATTRSAPLTTSFKITLGNFGGTLMDAIDVNLAVFR